MEQPTEKENEEMDRLDAQARGEGGEAVAEGDLAKFQEQIKSIEWDVDSRTGIRKTAESVVKLLQDFEPKVDLPDEPLPKVGALIQSNKDKSPEELAKILLDDYGFVETKQAAAEKKEAAAEEAVQCAANTSLVVAFNELADLYFAEGNRTAGATYKKVVMAISQLDYEITKDNAKGLGKGKTKVANIGAKSAEKIYEFVTTGTMEKLEEKRAAVGS